MLRNCYCWLTIEYGDVQKNIQTMVEDRQVCTRECVELALITINAGIASRGRVSVVVLTLRSFFTSDNLGDLFPSDLLSYTTSNDQETRRRTKSQGADLGAQPQDKGAHATLSCTSTHLLSKRNFTERDL